jgi:hypothetical protein
MQTDPVWETTARQLAKSDCTMILASISRLTSIFKTWFPTLLIPQLHVLVNCFYSNNPTINLLVISTISL